MTRSLRGDHRDGDVGGRLDQAEVNVESVTEEQRVTGLEVGFDVSCEDLGLGGVGGQHHDHIGPFGDLGGSVDVQALLFYLGPRPRTLLQPDAHLHTRVAQA